MLVGGGGRVRGVASEGRDEGPIEEGGVANETCTPVSVAVTTVTGGKFGWEGAKFTVMA